MQPTWLIYEGDCKNSFWRLEYFCFSFLKPVNLNLFHQSLSNAKRYMYLPYLRISSPCRFLDSVVEGKQGLKKPQLPKTIWIQNHQLLVYNRARWLLTWVKSMTPSQKMWQRIQLCCLLKRMRTHSKIEPCFKIILNCQTLRVLMKGSLDYVYRKSYLKGSKTCRASVQRLDSTN